MSKALMNLYDALNRLISNTPIRVALGFKINNDTVAREADLKRGAVKRSRPELAGLLEDIKKAEANRLGKLYSTKDSKTMLQHDVEKLKNKLNELQAKYDAQLQQLNSLIFENHRLNKELKYYIEEEKGRNIIKFKS